MTNLNDVKKYREELREIRDWICLTKHKKAIPFAIFILNKLIAGKLVEAEKEICICAAIKTRDGHIIRGHRHGDCFRNIEFPKFCEQGFITSKNRFVDRKEGAELQNKAGILSAWTKKPVEELLFSEDLY